MKIFLLRHTRVSGATGVCYGRSDVPLAETFETELAALRTTMRHDWDEIWTSPAARCVRLAERLAAGRHYRVDTRLQELHFGEWEGKTWETLRGPAVDAWMASPWVERPPGGETAAELVGRVARARDDALATPERKLIVTHAGVIRGWRSIVEQRALAELFAESVPHGEVIPIE